MNKGYFSHSVAVFSFIFIAALLVSGQNQKCRKVSGTAMQLKTKEIIFEKVPVKIHHEAKNEKKFDWKN